MLKDVCFLNSCKKKQKKTTHNQTGKTLKLYNSAKHYIFLLMCSS